MASASSTPQSTTFGDLYRTFEEHPCCVKASKMVRASANLAKQFSSACDFLKNALVEMDKGAHIQALEGFYKAAFQDEIGKHGDGESLCSLLRLAFLSSPDQTQGRKEQPSVIQRICDQYNKKMTDPLIGINELWRDKPAFVDVNGNVVKVSFPKKMPTLNFDKSFLDNKTRQVITQSFVRQFKSDCISNLVSSDPSCYPEIYKKLCIREVKKEDADAIEQPGMVGQLGLFNGSAGLQMHTSPAKPSLSGKKSSKKKPSSALATGASNASGSKTIKAGQFFAVYGGVVYRIGNLPVGSNHLVALGDEKANKFVVDGMLMPGGTANTLGSVDTENQVFKEKVLIQKAGNLVIDPNFNAIRVPIPATLHIGDEEQEVELGFLVALKDIPPGAQILCPYGWDDPKPINPYFLSINQAVVDALEDLERGNTQEALQRVVNALPSDEIQAGIERAGQANNAAVPQRVAGLSYTAEQLELAVRYMAQQSQDPTLS